MATITVETITVDELRALRMRALGLAAHAPATPEPAGATAADRVRAVAAVGERFLAMQGQDLGAARWALGVRVPGATLADVDAAFDEGLLIRSWPMRGTLHVVSPRDIGWIQALTTPRVTGTSAVRRREQLGLDLSVIERARETAVGHLEGGRRATRDELLAAFAAAGIALSPGWGYHIVWHLAQTGTLCLGPMSGRDQALVLVDEWAPDQNGLEREDALAELAVRYFAAHGPATVKDLAWWAGLPLRDVRAGIARAGDALAAVTVDDLGEHWLPADLLGSIEAADGEPLAGVWALPGFDEHLLGYADRIAVLDPRYAARVVPGRNGVFRPTIVADGRAVGTWSRTITTGATPRVEVEAEPFGRLSRAEKRGFEAATRRYGDFLGLERRTRP